MRLTGFVIRTSGLTLLQGALAVAALRADLSWESKALSLVADPDEAEVKVVFRFRNDTPRTIGILAVDTACGCLTVDPPVKTAYAPGASGELGVTYYPASSAARETKTLMVRTDEPSAIPALLQLTVETPPPSVTIRPQVLLWLHGQPFASKTVRMEVRRERRFEFAGAALQGAGFQVVAQRIVAGKPAPELVVAPVLGAAPGASAILEITFNRPGRPPKVYRVNLFVK